MSNDIARFVRRIYFIDNGAIAYIVGGIIGILAFSRVLSYLLKKYRALTLSFIIGLMIGALRKPAEVIIQVPDNIGITLIAGIIGVILVGLIGYYNQRKKIHRLDNNFL